MSDELGQLAEDFLKTSSIVTHKYGIPKLEPSESFLPFLEISELESKYFKSYKQLNFKLNKLLYLNKLKELESTPESEINDQLSKIKSTLLIDDNQELLDFLILQNSEIKIEKLLLRYLLMIKPILKSTHQTDLNPSELSILKKLKKLYDFSSENPGTVFQKISQSDLQLEEGNYDLIKQTIVPLIEESKELSQELLDLNKRYVLDKLNKVANDDDGRHRRKFINLVERWTKLESLCIEIPRLICDLHINWYNDKELVSMITQVDSIQNKLNKYLSVVNKETVLNYTTKELLALEFPD
ncbi:hypothetical protein SBY92_002944 [Candida maltosa Xu316]|uniref:Uncharacterized protein n=1 Tax=Candida maltosa (strain Xu316) TaxID=1245528 RepID=M3JZU1_CANMX|nr:hypothetical protein G210_1581 [Candida maltosa Xu316]